MTKRAGPTLGDKLRKRRLDKKMSQYEVAQQAGLRPEVISRLERGRSDGSLISLHKLAPVLGFTIDELVKDQAMTHSKKGKKSA